MKQLILGGARSGKTSLAQRTAQQWQAQRNDGQVIYLATAQAGDGEMQQRIERHQQERPAQWLTEEEPLAIDQVIGRYSNSGHCLLIDCLTLWLTNLLMLDDESKLEQQIRLFEAALAASQAEIILVSNETGMGVVPMGELSRNFVDQSGFLHQRLAQYCDRVTLTVAGLPMRLKDETIQGS